MCYYVVVLWTCGIIGWIDREGWEHYGHFIVFLFGDFFKGVSVGYSVPDL